MYVEIMLKHSEYNTENKRIDKYYIRREIIYQWSANTDYTPFL